MDSTAKNPTDFIEISRFQSLRTKILIFAWLATIIPSLILGGLFYLQNSRLLKEKLSHELNSATVQASGKLDLWINERLYDLRVFSSSYIVSENLARVIQRPLPNVGAIVALDHMKGYLESVRSKFDVYTELTLVTLNGKSVVSTADDLSQAAIPAAWEAYLGRENPLGGKIYLEPYINQDGLHLAEVVRALDGIPLGILFTKIHLEAIHAQLALQAGGNIDEIYLVDSNQRLLVSSAPIKEQGAKNNVKSDFRTIFQEPYLELKEFVCYNGHEVTGMATPIGSTGWLLVAEMEAVNAYAEIAMLRRLTVWCVGGLMVCVGLSAFFFGHSIVRPLRRLSKEAARVASGNLDVDIPVAGRSEVSYLTQVFNRMVANLRQGREELSTANKALIQTNRELEQLSITDDLTGLFNRKKIMEQFHAEVVRARRSERPLAVLMLDVDHFKETNDTYGHQAGDVVLQQLAVSLLALVRECDFVGRYGGEEFLLLLPESSKSDGITTAERIRDSISDLSIEVGSETVAISVSIGVSGFPDDGLEVASVLRMADDALYYSKDNGRNQVTVAGAHLPAIPAESGQGQSLPQLQLIGR